MWYYTDGWSCVCACVCACVRVARARLVCLVLQIIVPPRPNVIRPSAQIGAPICGLTISTAFRQISYAGHKYVIPALRDEMLCDKISCDLMFKHVV